MNYIKKEENIEREYNVTYDKEKLKDLMDRIVKTASYTEKGTYSVTNGKTKNKRFRLYEYEDGLFTGEQPTLTNGDPLFKTTTTIFPINSEDKLRVCGTRVVEPGLSQILNRILKDDEGIETLVNYENSSELVKIDEKISNLIIKIDSTDNYNTSVKIGLLKELEQELYSQKSGRFFNTELLKAYYEEAKSLFEFELVRETKTTSGVKTFYKDIFNNNKGQSK